MTIAITANMNSSSVGWLGRVLAKRPEGGSYGLKLSGTCSSLTNV